MYCGVFTQMKFNQISNKRDYTLDVYSNYTVSSGVFDIATNIGGGQ